MESNIYSIKKACCGCGACAQKCPKKAITMTEDKNGFLYPKIDKEKCINCGLCLRVCPSKKNNDISINKIKAYAAKNKNTTDLKKSSSGGIFSAIAKYILNQNGVVYGAAYSNDLSVKHIRIEKESELFKLQGSKYVQSNTTEIYEKVKKDLEQQKEVLFSGTPCQIKGLTNYLIKKYDNLTTCDLVCHGVPSQKLFKKYINYLEKKHKKRIISYDFRNKEKKGWGLTSKIVFEDKSEKYINSDFDRYYSNFLNCNTYRESCYNCKFANLNRPSDITLADYWGVLSIHNDFYNKNGVSLILVNTTKGEKIMNDISQNVEIIETDINYAITKNKNLIMPSKKPTARKKIYDDIDKKDYIKKNLKTKITIKKIIKIFVSPRLKKQITKVILKLKKR